MAVYEKKIPLLMQIVIAIFEILEPILNSRFSRRIITFITRNSNLGKVTRFLENINISF
ncbi:MAG: hypothetical protein ACFFD2_10760 [Promethearchaeota archaeon]